MAAVDIIRKISEKVQINGDDYVVNVSTKQLWKFYLKIQSLSPDVVELTVKQFIDDKKKAKIANGYYNDEVIKRNIEFMTQALIKYMEDVVKYQVEEDVEESINVDKTYVIKEESEEDISTEKDNELDNGDL